MKFQIPNPKLQSSSKFQAPIGWRVWIRNPIDWRAALRGMPLLGQLRKTKLLC